MLFNLSPPRKDDLELDLGELGKGALKELFLSSRRLKLYSRGHSRPDEACKNSFIWLKKLFRLRSYFDFHLYRGTIYSMGIPLEDDFFIRGLKSELSKFFLGSVYIYSQITPKELFIFLRCLNEKLLAKHKKTNLQRFLVGKGVKFIRVKEYEQEDPFIEDGISFVKKCDDFKVRTLAKSALQEDPQVAHDILLRKIKKDIDLEGRVRYDFRLRIFQSVVAEEFSELPEEKVKKLLENESERRNLKKLLMDKEYLDRVKKSV